MPPATRTRGAKSSNNGLFILIRNIATTISTNFGTARISDTRVRTFCSKLSVLLNNPVTLSRRENITSAIDTSNLSYYVMRTRNPEETKVTKEGEKIRGEKKWYYLAIVEKVEGKVHILAEGDLREKKGDLLEGLMVSVKKQVDIWEKVKKQREQQAKASAKKVGRPSQNKVTKPGGKASKKVAKSGGKNSKKATKSGCKASKKGRK